MKQQLYAELPADLAEADEILLRYGRWARGGSGPGTCGSAEGDYRAPQDDEDRQPKSPEMLRMDIDRARASLIALPTMSRLILQWIYVRPASLPANMRKHGLQPHHTRELHLLGVREFWRHWQRLQPITKSTVAIPSVVLENICT